MDYKQVRARFIAASVLAFALPIEVFAMTNGVGSMESQATVQRAPAEKAALSKVPNGMIKSGRLESAHGKLVWAFEVTMPRSRNVTEVLIDAKNGHILSSKVEKRPHLHEARADVQSAH